MKNADKHRLWTNERLDIIRKVTGETLPLPYNFIEYPMVDEGFCTYQDWMPYSFSGIKFHPRYEGKCLHYIQQNLSTFRQYLNGKSLFWIIGSEPK